MSRSLSHKQQKHLHCPLSEHHKIATLRTLMQDIKYLQNYVGQLQPPTLVRDSHFTSIKKKPPNTAKTANQYSNYTAKKKNVSSNRDKRIHSVKTIRKQESLPAESLSFCFKNIGTIPVRSLEQSSMKQVETQKANSAHFASLMQIQNLNLQKENLCLQKQLLQKQLEIEKREKQLLKKRLKKMKSYYIENKLANMAITQNQNYSVSIDTNAFASPIKISIPEFNHKQIRQSQNCHYKEIINQKRLNGYTSHIPKNTSQSVTLRSRSVCNNLPSEHSDMQSLLLTNSQLGKCKQKHSQQSQQLLQGQFWRLMKHCHQDSNNKWQVRQALGDIANRLKVVRSK